MACDHPSQSGIEGIQVRLRKIADGPGHSFKKLMAFPV
ncbi:hypothetical protein AZ25_3073 [Bordetella holmesii 04P3421]|uniref:Uncharacterized protein n=1 Tax=Bordetella holmesii CDC-H585-BH TaxID=1331206 RepID=A0A158MAY2_9BORD|nr:hypothetical protein L497_3302 [Bordetella holmesii CDC-H585-BH]KCV09359.1 hypothetical protein AZ25_3073 [Bordetella holmesii 04P3421]KCV11602.1 hypothetical protein L502_3251 [Bordetella holmesii CDC-H785-BH]